MTTYKEVNSISFDGGSTVYKFKDENFIPANTTFTIKNDGTGDFTNLSSANNYLQDKWSNGTVILKVVGTIYETTSVNFVGNAFNIPEIQILGTSSTDYGVVSTSASGQCFGSVDGANIHIKYISFVSTNGTKAYRGAIVSNGAKLRVENCSFSNFIAYCPGSYQGGHLIITGKIEVSDCVQGINMEAGICQIQWGTSLSFTNIEQYCFRVIGGGIIQGANSTVTYTNAPNHFSQTLGTATSDGWITGLTV